MKLPRIRLHLLTCIVLMFAAGALIWANVTPRDENVFVVEWDDRDSPTLERKEAFVLSYGWPCRFQPDWSTRTLHTDGKLYGRAKWRSREGAYNLGAALGILLFTAVVSEWWLRRRERSRGSRA